VLTYLIARRRGDDTARLSSRFVSVIEPFNREPIIKSVRPIDGTAVEVLRIDGGADLVRYDAHEASGRVVVERCDPAGTVTGRFVAGNEMITGSVVSVDAPASKIRIKPGQNAIDPSDFVARVVHFRNDARRTAHTVAAATREGDEIVITTADDLLVGRARVDAVEDRALRTKTSLPLAPIYRGVTVTSEKFEPLARVDKVENGRITLATPLAESARPAAGDDVWLVNVGAGDRFELPAVVDIHR